MFAVGGGALPAAEGNAGAKAECHDGLEGGDQGLMNGIGAMVLRSIKMGEYFFIFPPVRGSSC